MPQSTKLTELTIKEASGVDHPAHLHEGWMVMKSEDDLDSALDQITEPDSQENNVELTATPEVEEVVDFYVLSISFSEFSGFEDLP